MTNSEVLNLEFYSNDLDETLTIKEFFKRLLLRLWEEQDCFSGKRPFGNSGWYYDIIICLIHNKIIKGTTDLDGYLEDYDKDEAFNLIEELIKEI